MYVLMTDAQVKSLALLTRGGANGNVIVTQKNEDVEVVWASLDGSLNERYIEADGAVGRGGVMRLEASSSRR